MSRRSYRFEALEVILSVILIGMTVVLFLRSSELTFLFPAVFAVAAVLSLLAALEGIVFNRNRVVRKSRAVVFGILTLILIVITYISFRVVM